jgi:hypothetical protein
VPAANVFGIPFGLTFFGTAFSESKLITLATPLAPDHGAAPGP